MKNLVKKYRSNRSNACSTIDTHNKLIKEFFPFSIGLDNMFDRLSITRQNLCNTFPPFNIIKEGSKTIVEIALAGYDKDDISIVIEDGVLSIEGTGYSERVGDKDSPVHRGIASRRFTRQFTLGEHAEVNSATMKNGMLTVELEVVLPPEKQPKHIEIN